MITPSNIRCFIGRGIAVAGLALTFGLADARAADVGRENSDDRSAASSGAGGALSPTRLAQAGAGGSADNSGGAKGSDKAGDRPAKQADPANKSAKQNANDSSSKNKSPVVKKEFVQRGTDDDDAIQGTKWPDVMTGGKGKDQYTFTYSPKEPDDATLNDGDRITDYESEETIMINGVVLGDKHVKLAYDPKKDETRIEIDFPGERGEPDGKVDRSIILNGDKRGEVFLYSKCCTGMATEIYIEVEERAAKKKPHKPAKQRQVRTRNREIHRAAPERVPDITPMVEFGVGVGLQQLRHGRGRHEGRGRYED